MSKKTEDVLTAEDIDNKCVTLGMLKKVISSFTSLSNKDIEVAALKKD